MPITTIIQKVNRKRTDIGSANALLFMLRQGLRKLSGGKATLYRYALVAQPVPAQPLPARASRIIIRQIEPSDYSLDWFPRPPEIIDFRYRQDAVACYVAFKDEQAIGCLWLSHGPYLEDEVRCRFVPRPEGETVWDFDVYIDPAYRFGRTFVYLWEHAYTVLRARGVRWTCSRINTFNITSLRSHESLGAQTVGFATFIVLGRWQLLLRAGAPWVHLSRRACPKIDVPVPK